jgi:TPR repeat protein
VKCIMCRPFAWVRARLPQRCIADSPEAQRKFASWRYAQANDRQILESDPEREAVEATMQLERSDPVAAFPQFLALAERGSVWSMLRVAWLYWAGVGTVADSTQAERWYRQAFEGGCQRAQIDLANIYGSRGNLDECERIVQKSAAEHWAPAIYTMAMVRLWQPKTRLRTEAARVLLEEASVLGDLGAQWLLGRLMARGRFGWRRIPRGFRLTSDACEKTFALLGTNAPTAAASSSAVVVGTTEA